MFLVLDLKLNVVWGADTETIPATVKIGICGDGVAEGQEECDNDDFMGQTCYSLGYGGGSLICHSSCSLDTSLCIPRVPDKPDKDGPHRDDDPDYDEDDNNEIIRALREFFGPLANLIPGFSLPEFMDSFDINGDGKISLQELYDASRIWFDDWTVFREKNLDFEIDTPDFGLSCDLNDDGRCDLIDFSILMYYVNRY